MIAVDRPTPVQHEQNVRLCRYIRNTAQVPLATHDFDDDHAPVGEFLRDELVRFGLIEVREAGEAEPGGVYLTPAGEALL